MKAQLEKITSPTQSSLKAFLYDEETFNAPWHFHPEFELTYIIRSSGMRYVGDNVMAFKEDDLVLLGPNLPHCWKNTESFKGNAQSIVLQWKGDIMGKDWLEKDEFFPIRNLFKLASRGVKFSPDTVKKVTPKLRTILEVSPFKKILFLLETLNILAHDQTPLLLSGDNFAATLNHKTNDRVNRIYTFINNNYHRKISLTEIAKLTNMGEEAFCRFFKKTFDKPFFSFLNEYKVKLACKLLIESDLHVSEIAYQCGYESLPFFYRQFQKLMSCSPLVYRQKFKKTLS